MNYFVYILDLKIILMCEFNSERGVRIVAILKLVPK